MATYRILSADKIIQRQGIKLTAPDGRQALVLFDPLKFNPYHDNRGRFATAPGGPKHSMGPRALYNRVIESGGFTYQPVSQRSPREGFALSIFPERERIIERDKFSAKDIERYLEDNRDLLEQAGNHAGAWHDEEAGKVYLDVSRVVTDRNDAVQLCREHGQEGFYDLGKGETVIVKAEGERRKAEDRWSWPGPDRQRAGPGGGLPGDHGQVGEEARGEAGGGEGRGVTPLRAFAFGEVYQPGDPGREALEAALEEYLDEIWRQFVEKAARDIRAGRPVDEVRLALDLRRLLERILAQAGAEQALEIGNFVGVQFDPALVNYRMADWAKNYSYDLVKNLTRTNRRFLQKVVADFAETGTMTIGELIGRLVPFFGPGRSRAIATTEVTRAYAEASNAYKEDLAQVGIELTRFWLTNRDEKVCPICGPLHGKAEEVWAFDYPDGPPSHPNCRCSLALRYVRRQSGLFVLKFNPWHDNLGRFSSGAGGGGVFGWVGALNRGGGPQSLVKPIDHSQTFTEMDVRREANVDALIQLGGDEAKEALDAIDNWQHAAYDDIRHAALDLVKGGDGKVKLSVFMERHSSPEEISRHARSLLKAVDDAEGVAPKLYRGWAVNEADLAELKASKGKTVDVPLTSFSEDGADTAANFMRSHATASVWDAQRGGYVARTPHKVMFVLEPGAKAINIQNVGDRTFLKEQEWISGGRFRVKDVQFSPPGAHEDVYLVTIAQEATFTPPAASKAITYTAPSPLWQQALGVRQRLAPPLKFNPYHDARGRFSSANGGASSAVASKPRSAEEWRAGLSREERDAITMYTQNSYKPINQLLRGQEFDRAYLEASGGYERVKRDLKTLDGAMERAALDEELTVYRAGRAPVGGLGVGAEFVDRGFVSTCRGQQLPVNWAGDSDPPGYLFKLTLPKGAKAADIAHLGVSPSEQEVLVARGSRFKITRIHRQTFGHRPDPRTADARQVNLVVIETEYQGSAAEPLPFTPAPSKTAQGVVAPLDSKLGATKALTLADWPQGDEVAVARLRAERFAWQAGDVEWHLGPAVKFNPWHDEQGRFSSAQGRGAGGVESGGEGGWITAANQAGRGEGTGLLVPVLPTTNYDLMAQAVETNKKLLAKNKEAQAFIEAFEDWQGMGYYDLRASALDLVQGGDGTSYVAAMARFDGGGGIDERLATAQKARVMLAAVGDAPNDAPKLYRGWALSPEDLHEIAASKGKTIDVPLTSFSASPKQAREFARAHATQGNEVVYELRRGAKAVSVQGLGSASMVDEEEWISGGRFRVVDYIKPERAGPEAYTRVILEQAGTYDMQALKAGISGYTAPSEAWRRAFAGRLHKDEVLPASAKFNPYHDARGRFAPKNSTTTPERKFSQPNLDKLDEEDLAERQAIDAWGRPLHAAWDAKLTKRERKAIDDYKGGHRNAAYHKINRALRRDQPVPRDLEPMVRHLDSALAKGELPEAVVAWRGTRQEVFRKNFDRLKGATITDKGFVSTSLRDSHTRIFMGTNDVLLEMHLPKGMKAAYINPSEWEILLPRNLRYRVKDTYRISRANVTGEGDLKVAIVEPIL